MEPTQLTTTGSASNPPSAPSLPLKRLRSNEQDVPHGSRQPRRKLDANSSCLDEITPPPDDKSITETVKDDDLCPVCHLLLYRPVTTRCNHTLCSSCMARWADVSVTSQMTIVSLDEELDDFASATGVEAKCPMCRTQTSAVMNPQCAEELRQRYPQTYGEREVDEQTTEIDGTGGSVQTLTVYIGNKHQLTRPEPGSSNMHEWTFFVKPSRTDIVEEVHILLHPTFRPPRIIRQRAPYEIRRLGWGYFTIVAYVILKAGYSWVSDDAENAPDGAPKGALPLEWTLDFSGFGGRGSMGRCRLKVRSDRDWDTVDDEEVEDEQSWQRTVAQYARDGRWETDEE